MKKNYKTWLIASLFLLAFGNIQGQAVTFTSDNSVLSGNGGYEDCAVDMNGDYLDDIVRVTNGGILIDYQQADGSFASAMFPTIMQNTPDWSICAGDLDGNGFNDPSFRRRKCRVFHVSY